jgi:hypothetical protein
MELERLKERLKKGLLCRMCVEGRCRFLALCLHQRDDRDGPRTGPLTQYARTYAAYAVSTVRPAPQGQLQGAPRLVWLRRHVRRLLRGLCCDYDNGATCARPSTRTDRRPLTDEEAAKRAQDALVQTALKQPNKKAKKINRVMCRKH